MHLLLGSKKFMASSQITTEITCSNSSFFKLHLLNTINILDAEILVSRSSLNCGTRTTRCANHDLLVLILNQTN